VVLGRQNLQRVKAAFRSLRLKALFQVSSTATYEAHLASIYRRVSSAKPHRYGNLKVFWNGFGFTMPLNPQEEISFEPLCPRVQIGIHAKDPEREPAPKELAWTTAMVRHYGSDFVSIFYGAFGMLL